MERRTPVKRMVSSAVAALLWAQPLAAAAQNQAPVLPQHVGEYSPADIAYGAGVYAAQCAVGHGAGGDSVAGVNLRSGVFRNATTDIELTRVITFGIPNTGMAAFTLDAAEMAGIIAYLRNMNSVDVGSVATGDAVRGQAVFEGKGMCRTCHRVGAAGSRVAPNLSDIGSLRSPASLQRSLLDPTSQMMPINRPVRAVTRDGRVVNGRRLNEDTYSVQLVDDQARLVSLLKADLKEYTILTRSPMPSYADAFSPAERADLLAYLLSLKGR